MEWRTDKPKENGVYITTLVAEKKRFVVLTRYGDGRWLTGFKVKAWMPLPDAYEEVE